MTLFHQGLVFFAAIPLAVWMLATFCALRDEPGNRPRTLMRLLGAACGVLIFTLMTNRTLLEPVLWAGILVLVLHIVTNWGFRLLLLGVPIYTEDPAQMKNLRTRFSPDKDETERTHTVQARQSEQGEQ